MAEAKPPVNVHLEPKIVIDMTLIELLTGLDLSGESGDVLVTPEMLAAGKEAQETWFKAQGAKEMDSLFVPELATLVYRAMAAIDPIRNGLQLYDPEKLFDPDGSSDD